MGELYAISVEKSDITNLHAGRINLIGINHEIKTAVLTQILEILINRHIISMVILVKPLIDTEPIFKNTIEAVIIGKVQLV